MKILQLITDRHLRGAQVFASQLSDRLAGGGHDVILVSLYGMENVIAKTYSAKAKNIDLNGQKILLSFSLVRKLRTLMVDFAPDVVQANGSDTLKYVVLATRWLSHRPLLIYRNISMAGTWVRPGIQQKIYRYLFKRVDHVISLTEITRNEFIDVYQSSKANVSAIPIGVDLPGNGMPGVSRETLTREVGVPAGVPILLHVGSFSREKNHEGLLRILRKVRETVPAVLVLVGEGALRPTIMNQTVKTDLSNIVYFTGARTDISAWLSGANVFVLPSLVEGVPGVVLEAMAHRLPVVAYDVGAMREILKDGRSGYLVAAGDETVFAERIVRLLHDEQLGKTLSAAAFEKVKQTYTLDIVAAAFEQVYRNLIALP